MGNDVHTDGNSPARSKFDLVRDWKLPRTGDSLGSLCGLAGFYNRFIPHYEQRVHELRTLSRTYHRQPIPLVAWTPRLIKQFEDIKHAITSDPVLAHFSPQLPIFLKTDWSSKGMSYILMQPADDEASQTALQILRDGGENVFDKLMTGARLRPVRFGCRRCTVRESHYHSFIGEAASGRWAMGQNRRYLWGAQFYWLCDCNTVKEVLYYEGPLHQVCRLAQELFGYHFTVIHRPARMMADVDALNRFHEPLIAEYEQQLHSANIDDIRTRPFSYDPSSFPDHALKCPASKPADIPTSNPDSEPNPKPEPNPTKSHLVSISHASPAPHFLENFPVTFAPRPKSSQIITPDHQLSATAKSLSALCPPHWISFNSATGSLAYALSTLNHTCSSISFLLIEETKTAHDLCHHLLDCASIVQIPNFALIPGLIRAGLEPAHKRVTSAILPDTVTTVHTFLQSTPDIAGADFHCPYASLPLQQEWLSQALSVTSALAQHKNLRTIILSIPVPSISHATPALDQLISTWSSVSGWSCRCGVTSASFFGDAVFAPRWIAYCLLPTDPCATSPIFPCTNDHLNFAHCTDPAFNTPDHALATLQRHPGPASPPPDLPLLYCTITDPQTPSRRIPVYDMTFPIPEPSTDLNDTAFAHSFCITYPSEFGGLHLRAATASEVLQLYSFPASPLATLPSNLISAAPSLFPASLPFSFARHFAQKLFDNGAFPNHLAPTSSVESTINCFAFTPRPLPSNHDWSAAYTDDPDTKLIFDTIRSSADPPVWTNAMLGQVHASYRSLLQNNSIQVMRDRLVIFQDLPSQHHRLMLIIVPKSLRRIVFSAYHSSPSAGHLGPYKTLHRIRSRFFWPRVTSDVHEWCKECANCILANNRTRKHHELSFSWPISTPFFILHADLWEPGRVAPSKLSSNASTHLLAAMCDLTGFIILDDIRNPTAESLSACFMKNFLLKVGLCGLVVIDDDSKFKAEFIEMCEILGIRHHCVAKHNHKALSVERFFRVLNKAVTIAAADRKVPPSKIFIETAQCTAYAWNSSAIDGTDIIRSVAALGREFKFPFDLTLDEAPTPVYGDLSAVHSFLRLAQDQSVFSRRILEILTADRRAYHQERVNAHRNQQLFQVGDHVTARVTVQSNAANSRVAKLSYRARGPFEVVAVSGHGAYTVRPAGKPDAATRTYHAEDLTLLPPVIRPCEPVDGPDLRYSNSRHAPVHHPFRSHFNIKLYNETWLSRPIDAHPPALSESEIPPPLPDDPAAVTVGDDMYDMPIVRSPHEDSEPSIPHPSRTSQTLHQAILQSSDKLFFVRYHPTGVLRARWYLVSVDLEQCQQVPACQNAATTGQYYVHFLCRHPNDSSMSDVDARWWPEWHEYTQRNNIIDYGPQVMIYPGTQPNARKYIAWADVVNLTNRSTTLLGPFDFQDPSSNPPGRSPTFRQYVSPRIWSQLHQVCIANGIQPPILSMPDKVPVAERRKRSLRRFQNGS